MCISVRICQSSDYPIAEMDSYEVQIAVKFCNMEAEPDHNLIAYHEGLYIIGDGSGITHSLSHASSSVYMLRDRWFLERV